MRLTSKIFPDRCRRIDTAPRFAAEQMSHSEGSRWVPVVASTPQRRRQVALVVLETCPSSHLTRTRESRPQIGLGAAFVLRPEPRNRKR